MPMGKLLSLMEVYSWQMAGGYGYSKMFPFEKILRDLRLPMIYEGTSEIQRLVIATNILKE